MNDHSDPNPGDPNQDDPNQNDPNQNDLNQDVPNQNDPNQDEANPGDNNPGEPKRSEGRRHRRPDDGEPMESGVLPEDFGRRLERLKEASGLSWRGLGRALGVDPKRLGQWRKGVEPCGGAMHSIHRFASRMPGGWAIIMGEDYQTSFFDEDVEDDDVEVDEEDKQGDEEEDREEDPDG